MVARIYDHIMIVLMLHARHYLISFTKQYFFLNSNPDSLLLKKTQGWSHFKLNMIDEIFHFYKISRIYQ